jgi:hypothetical protein
MTKSQRPKIYEIYYHIFIDVFIDYFSLSAKWRERFRFGDDE